MTSPRFLPPADAFGRTASLSFTTTFPAYGVPLEVRSNAAAALDLAEVTFGAWRGLDRSLVRLDRPARLDVVVHEPTGRTLPARLTYRRHGPVFLAASGSCLCAVLLEQQHAVCFVPQQALGDPEWFGAHVNGCGLLAVSQHDRVPLHGAAVVSNGHAAVLVGPSGIGKSTLAYACHAAGLQVLSEEAVFVSLGDGPPRLWGHVPSIWLDPLAVRFFPELAGQPVVERPSGKRRVAAPARAGEARPLLTHSGPTILVVLGRATPGAGLRGADRGTVESALAACEEEGFDQYPTERPAVEAWLTTLPAYQLDVGADPHLAAGMLRELLSAADGSLPL